MSKFLPSEVARLVLSYLLENKLERTREVFLSECPALAELATLTAAQQLHGSKVNGRNLSKILRDYNRSDSGSGYGQGLREYFQCDGQDHRTSRGDLQRRE